MSSSIWAARRARPTAWAGRTSRVLGAVAPMAVATLLLGGGCARPRDGGGSYLSSSAPAVHLGLGGARAVDSLEVRWPSGRLERRSNIAADTVMEWDEPAPQAD